MKAIEMIDLGAKLDGIIYKRNLNRLTRLIDARAGTWEKKIKMNIEQSNDPFADFCERVGLPPNSLPSNLTMFMRISPMVILRWGSWPGRCLKSQIPISRRSSKSSRRPW